MFSEPEDIPLRLRKRIEPPSAFMNDDDDVRTPPEFDGPACAFLRIDSKTGLLEHGGAGHSSPQVIKIMFVHSLAGCLASAFLS